MSRESITVYDDGSLESKVMQFELKTSYDLNVVQVGPYDKLSTWLEKAKDDKVFLHFPFEQYITSDIRTEIMEEQRKNPKLRIIPWYEQAHREGIKNRAANYGISTVIENKTNKQEFIKEDNTKPYIFGDNDKGRETIIIYPDDEMKREYSKPYIEETGSIFKQKSEEFKNKRRSKKTAK